MKLFKVLKFIFIPGINRILSRLLRPFAKLIPVRYHFPVMGFFKVNVSRVVSFYIEGHLTSYITTVCFWEGIKGFEYNSIRIFTDLVKEANLFIDIGANIGYYSLLAASINNRLNVIAFEPFHDACEALKLNITYNRFSNIRVEKTALSDKPGNATFYYTIHKDFPDYKYQLGGKNSLVELRDSLYGKTEVSTMTLDDYAMQNTIDVADLIKMDTEATEYFILKGSETLIKRCKPIILCEVLTGTNEEEMEELMLRLGYGFYKVEDKGLRPESSLKNLPDHKNDYFFVPGEKEYLIQKYLVS